MKNILKTIFIALAVLFVLFVIWIFIDDEEEYGDNIGEDIYTLMIYICGADLESEGGYASDDIKEMLEAKIDEKVNVLIETGGTSQWQDLDISNKHNQIYKVENGELLLEKNFNKKNKMTDPDNLLDFINYCSNNYPADRYSLILWDHGGGAISGYGYDENYDDEDTLTIDELKTVIKKSNLNYEFLGFDACLMANFETAYSLKDNVKYLIASEETEPGSGWEYKSLISKLSSNTSADTTELGKIIVDKFINSNNTILDFDDATLSIIDLSKIDKVYSALLEFVKEIKNEQLEQEEFAYISKAISNTKSFGEGEYDTIDLVNFAETINNSKSEQLIKAVKEAIVYCQNTDLVENTNGLSLYWPYEDLSYYDEMIRIYKNIEISDEYIDVLTQFANFIAGGKKNTYSINNHEYYTNSNYSQYGWYNENTINQYESYYDNYSYDEDLEIKQVGDRYILELDDEDWDVITNITCEVMFDDGEGYIDLGSDDYFETDNNGNLIIDFDGSWITIGDYIVPYYAIDNEKYYAGKVPAYLNDEEVNLIIKWDDEEGKIIGAEPINRYGNTTLNYKGLKKIQRGDKIEFIFDYYNYNGDYDDSYVFMDEPMTIRSEDDLIVGYAELLDEGTFYVYYKITDIYNNDYYTEAILIEN